METVEATPDKEQIPTLLAAIEQANSNMNALFEKSILRHEQQFVRTYRIKIAQLVQLYQQLKTQIEDKTLNNAIALQLDIVSKERDYFKYECLRLNNQLKNLQQDHNALSLQNNNMNEQTMIYKHLLENEKVKSTETYNNMIELRKNMKEMMGKYKGWEQGADDRCEDKSQHYEKEINKLQVKLKQKNELIRVLKQRVYDFETALQTTHSQRIAHNQLYELFRSCVDSWKRERMTKSRKQNISAKQSILPLQQFTSLAKKQLLKHLFTQPQFLIFLQRLLFDNTFKVTFETTQEHYMSKNRQKLYNYMYKHRITPHKKLV